MEHVDRAEKVRIKTTISFEMSLPRSSYGADFSNEDIRSWEQEHALENAEFAIEQGDCVVAVEVWTDTAQTGSSGDVE